MSNIPPELLAEMMPGVRAFVESLVTQTAEMQAQNDELKAQVRKLTPMNSSVPSSTQDPQASPPAKPKPKSTKKPGGQNGHKCTIREVVPVEKCTEVIPLLPTECRGCNE